MFEIHHDPAINKIILLKKINKIITKLSVDGTRTGSDESI